MASRSVSRGLGLLCTCAMLIGCSRPIGAPIARAPSPICEMNVNGNALKDARGNSIVLHGATLPSLAQMEAGGEPVEARLKALAQNGARIVRLTVQPNEITPTFVPGKLMPFVEQAQALGMVVVFGWVNNGADKAKYQAQDAEDFFRILLTYLKDVPGVWIDPFTLPMTDTDAKRQRIAAQRIVDVARGLKTNNIVLINFADWLFDADPALSQPLIGLNVVYGLENIERLSPERAASLPFMAMDYDGPAEPLARLGIGSVAPLNGKLAERAPIFKSSVACR